MLESMVAINDKRAYRITHQHALMLESSPSSQPNREKWPLVKVIRKGALTVSSSAVTTMKTAGNVCPWLLDLEALNWAIGMGNLDSETALDAMLGAVERRFDNDLTTLPMVWLTGNSL